VQILIKRTATCSRTAWC